MEDIRELDGRYQQAHTAYNEKVAVWNQEQTRRKRSGRAAQTARKFLEFLGLG